MSNDDGRFHTSPETMWKMSLFSEISKDLDYKLEKKKQT